MEAPFRTHIHCLLQHTEPTESEVTATSLKNLSLTCKKTRQICSPIIFRTMAICFAVESLSNLYRVSLTPYAGMVREIRYGGPILLKSGKFDIVRYETNKTSNLPEHRFPGLGHIPAHLPQILVQETSRPRILDRQDNQKYHELCLCALRHVKGISGARTTDDG